MSFMGLEQEIEESENEIVSILPQKKINLDTPLSLNLERLLAYLKPI